MLKAMATKKYQNVNFIEKEEKSSEPTTPLIPLIAQGQKM